MYKVTVFETAKELLDAFLGDDPQMPESAYIVFDGEQCVRLSSEEKQLPFEVGGGIAQSDVIKEMAYRAGVKVYLT